MYVPNDLEINKNFIPPSNLETSNHLKSIGDWTMKQKMLLNTKKTTNMINNFTENINLVQGLTLKERK